MKRAAVGRDAVLVVGGRGEFGQFLRRDVLPRLGAEKVLSAEKDTPPARQSSLFARARHVVLATPLRGYERLAREVVDRSRGLRAPMTLWLIPSVQAGVWRAVTEALAGVGNPHLSAVFAHPMYGPNGFRDTEPEARTFRNILTASHEGAEHPLAEELSRVAEAFRRALHIPTTTEFDPEEHDRVTAYSQGLSYCVAELMFERPGLDLLVREQAPDLWHSFHANRNLIADFLSLNAYAPRAADAFARSLARTGQTTYEDLLRAFALADEALNGGAASPIPTKWYEKLRAAAHRL